MRIGIYGGSFDPPHVAHVLLAAYALSIGEFDRILVVPVFSHAFNKALAPFEHRLRLCELAFRELPKVEISALESQLPTPSLTLTTVERIAALHPGASLRLLVGTDVLRDAGKWHAFDAIVRLAPLFVVGRDGHAGSSDSRFALPPVSSTRVRALCGKLGDPNARSELDALVPAAVVRYVEEHHLYRL
jgi:nicotinate-nucleotide adenylyltransferase